MLEATRGRKSRLVWGSPLDLRPRRLRECILKDRTQRNRLLHGLPRRACRVWSRIYPFHGPHNFVWSGVVRLNGHDTSAPSPREIDPTYSSCLAVPNCNNDGRGACPGISHYMSTLADTVRFLSRRTSQVDNDIDGLPRVINHCFPFMAWIWIRIDILACERRS